MRRAGASFGIVTEFVYKVFQHPETLSVVAMAFLKDRYDLQRLTKAGQEGRYAISITQPMFYRRPKPAHLIGWGFIKVPRIVKFKAGTVFKNSLKISLLSSRVTILLKPLMNHFCQH